MTIINKTSPINIANIAFWFGTEAEVIKTFPVILELRKLNINPRIISTGQNNLLKSQIVKDFNLSPDITIYPFTSKKTPINLLWWFIMIFLKFPTVKKFIKINDVKYIVVHGDTVSTLLGSLLGKLAGAKIIHLEAGLRSFNLLNPFPEEINRIVVSKISTLHFCQDEKSIHNLKQHNNAKVVNTFGNVICDAVDIFEKANSSIREQLSENYAIVTFHRAEQLLDDVRLKILVDTLIDTANQIQVLFVLFEFTEEVLKNKNLLEKIILNKNIIVTSRVQYPEFINLMKTASFVITDGGSNQEELAYLGIPTLIMRTHTEREDGLGRNVILSKFNLETINHFLLNYKSLRFDRKKNELTPTEIVVKELLCLK